jgi:dTDP-glucose pyrophosphorylase
MAHYRLATLKLACIRETLVISTPEGRPRFEALPRDGSPCGIEVRYCVQPSPNEVAHRGGSIDAASFEPPAEPLMTNSYGQYLRRILDERVF